MTTFFGSSSHTSVDGMTEDLKFVNIFTATASGSITTARMYAGGQGAGTSHVRFVVYAVSGGVPAGLLGYSDELVIGASDAMALLTFTFSTPVTGIVSGTSYALGTIQGGHAYLIGDIASGTMSFNNDTYSDGPANPFGSRSTATLTGAFEAGVDASATPMNAPFVSAATSLYTMGLLENMAAPFISSSTTLYTPSFIGDLANPYISAGTTLFTPTLAGSGIGTIFGQSGAISV